MLIIGAIFFAEKNLKLLYCDGVGPTCGSFDLDHVTHYLKFSVKINTNHLHRHFMKQVPYLEKEVSRMVGFKGYF